ncbi:Eukaryotic peptide chain release factor subunit 1-3 [Vitis vinifera]|uniref:Eukaryotic peptide chain release factor subunit 1-3 n=1 Tax=Vitis vinifera TaxID=29760 RepID=A0A438G223_VITVI|nr:Eukaryotic peptide chain release factor subunit 1-3 [Vitis vinifera]
MADGHETDKNIEIWKIKKLIKALEAARGNGTSMISLIMPPRDQISRVTKMLGDEFGTASNIKSRVNRQSVLGAITSAQQRLKLYNKVPPNGLVLYTGTIVTEDGKEKKVTIDFEPFRPINASLYLCDNKFHTEALNELLESDDKFGLLSWMETRLATQFFINPATSQPNVSGLILAGSADFKTELREALDREIFEEISQDTGKYILKNNNTGEIVIKHLNKEQESNQSHFKDAATSAELEVQEKMSLLEWLLMSTSALVVTLEFVTNKSQEGSQFCRGFGGIGGILRYQLDMRSFDEGGMGSKACTGARDLGLIAAAPVMMPENFHGELIKVLIFELFL